jgi:hypothetical protein
VTRSRVQGEGASGNWDIVGARRRQFGDTEGMNREKSEEHLHEIKNVLQDFVERWDVLADDEKKGLQERAKKGLGHIDGIISYVHSAEKE